ncbi:MAG TPA: hypothetical protein VK934_01425 [Fimbriimonas sp.]|nr:hypothetical protein [Fimbriimonas sp.]
MHPMSQQNWWSRGEQDLISLYQWIDLQTHGTANDRRGGIYGAVVGSFWGLMGASMGVLAGAMQIDPRFSIAIPVAAGLMTTAAMTIWYVKGRTTAEKAYAKTMGEMRSFLWKLISARWQGGVKALIGEEPALALNAAAYEYLQCRTALNSPAWQAAGSESPWASARDKTRIAMDVAMSRLVTLIGQGARPNDPAILELISDMKRTAQEATETANRLASHHNLPTDATNELKKALGEMRALNDADKEFSELAERELNT